MKFLTMDVNRRLLVLIVLSLLLVIISTVYYEKTLKDILSKKSENSRIDEVTAQLILEKLNSSNRQKDLAMVDRAVLEDKYNRMIIEADNLKKENQALQEEISFLKSQAEYQKAKDIGPTEQFRLFQSKTGEISKLNGMVKELCNELEANNITGRECLGID